MKLCPPSYIYHQGKEFYCVRKYRGILATTRKERERAKLDDRRFKRAHVPMDLKLYWKRHINKGKWWWGADAIRHNVKGGRDE